MLMSGRSIIAVRLLDNHNKEKRLELNQRYKGTTSNGKGSTFLFKIYTVDEETYADEIDFYSCLLEKFMN